MAALRVMLEGNIQKIFREVHNSSHIGLKIYMV